MGCSADIHERIQGNFMNIYKYILIESDFKNIGKNPCYLISTDSIPIFIKIIKESKILEFKNDPSENVVYAYKRNVFKLLCSYKLENNIKIYNNFEECRSLANDYNEIENEFIIVTKKFLTAMQI